MLAGVRRVSVYFRFLPVQHQVLKVRTEKPSHRPTNISILPGSNQTLRRCPGRQASVHFRFLIVLQRQHIPTALQRLIHRDGLGVDLPNQRSTNISNLPCVIKTLCRCPSRQAVQVGGFGVHGSGLPLQGAPRRRGARQLRRVGQVLVLKWRRRKTPLHVLWG